MRVFLVLIFLCVSKILFAQWDIRPVGGDWFAYDTVLYRVPLGTSVNAGVTMYVYQTVGGQSYSLSLTSRMDSIRGAGFNPQQSGNVTSTISTYYPITENIIYRAGYEDTSIVHFIATSSFYDRDLYIMGIATISAASSFSLSKTDFGVLSTGDTSQTVLRLFNQTGDSERIVFSFTNGRDLTLLDPVVMPMTLAPGDSAAPLRISYRANGIRRVYNDSLFIQVQRLRNGTNYGSELDSFVALQGRCYPIYFRLSDTAFPRIRAGDSLVGSLMIYNPTSDTEQTWVYFSPSGDFYSSSTVDTQVVINPFDSSSSMPIWMHAIVGRKSVIDTLFLHLKWKGSDVDKLPILFSSVLSGGCSDLRFRVDSLFHHVFAFVGQQVSDSALIFNLTSDSLKLYMGCASNNEWISSIGSAGTSQSFGPFDSASVHFTFRPSTSGSDHDAYLNITDEYDPQNYLYDSRAVCFVGDALPSNSVLTVSKDFMQGVFPNPFIGKTRIRFIVAKPGYVHIGVYNLLGEEICDLYSAQANSGDYSFVWDATNLPCGVYECIMNSIGQSPYILFLIHE